MAHDMQATTDFIVAGGGSAGLRIVGGLLSR